MTTDLTGQVFGRLTVLSLSGKNKHNRYVWLCSCSCGGQTECNTSDLRSGNTSSCGCLRKETAKEQAEANTTHGMTNEPGFKSWQHMVDRCTNPDHPKYHLYGGRGIKVHEEWKEDPRSFLQHIGPRPSQEHSIDREDNDGHYVPGNVRWATQEVQTRNTSRNINVEYEGRTFVLKDLATELGIPYGSLKYQVSTRKKSISDAIEHIRGRG